MTDVAEEVFSFGTWVRHRRKALDLTQAALAHRLGCAVVTIRKLEADALRPSREIAARLATCLDLPPAEHATFLQVARAERGVRELSPPRTGISRVPTVPAPSQRQVARLPLDAIPCPAALPAGSRMPLRRNPLFVGREAELRQLAWAFTLDRTAALGQVALAAITGLGGIGKTQLACEFVYRYGPVFTGGVLWLSLADPAAVPAEVAACGGAAGLQLCADFDTLPLDEQVRRVVVAWTSPLPRLLVFDNCEDEALLDQWCPAHGGCRVLVTSRRCHWSPTLGVQLVPLDVLAREESVALLRAFRADVPADDWALDAIAATLGDLPLALHLAGSFLAHYQHALTPTDYLDRLRTPTFLTDRSLHAAGVSPTKHI
jgi:transcriptional regulator with XRE-family HTH domain